MTLQHRANEVPALTTSLLPQSKVAMSVAEFCEAYGVSPSFARELIKTRKIQSVCAGRRRLVSVLSAKAWFHEILAAEEQAAST